MHIQENIKAASNTMVSYSILFAFLYTLYMFLLLYGFCSPVQLGGRGVPVAVASSCCQVGVWECVHILCLYVFVVFCIVLYICVVTSLYTVWSVPCPLCGQT